MNRTHFILFIEDQVRSREFYSFVLGIEPVLDVPGMTEFELPGGGVLGLMPSEGIATLLGSAMPNSGTGNGDPRAELYLVDDEAEEMLERALEDGAILLSPFQDRDWGHRVAYCFDPDRYVVAVAREIDSDEEETVDTVIVTERLRLRSFHVSDAPEIQRLAGAREIAETTAAIPHPYEDGMAEAWIASHGGQKRNGTTFHWAVTREHDGALVGAISLMDINEEVSQAELGYWIAVDHWNKGYASEAATAVVSWGIDTLGLNRVHAHHFTRNPASGAVLRKAGMRYEGSRRQHFGRWGRREDIELYGILAEDRE